MSTLSVAPVPEAVPTPGTQSTFSDKAPDTSTITRTRGLYVTQGSTTQRLIDYTEALDGKTKIYAIDDDKDGDQDVYYSLGNIIYRKENHLKTPSKYYISDAPKIYTVSDIYSEFFGSTSQTLESIPYDGQIHLSQGNSYNRMDLKFLTRSTSDHFKLLLFRSLLKRNNTDAEYIIDVSPKSTTDTTKNSIQTVPYIVSSEGKTTLTNNTVYRTLIP